MVITAPGAGAPVSGASVSITANIGGSASTAGTYQIDGSATWTALGTAWDTTLIPNGSHTIRVKSNATPTGYSDMITVIVNNGNVPTFVWTTPVPGSAPAYAATVDSTYTVGNFTAGTVQYSG